MARIQEFNQLTMCPLCQSDLKPWQVSPSRYKLSHCSRCQLVLQNPPIEDPELYSGAYFGVEEDDLASTSFFEMKKWSFGKMIVPVLNKVSLEGGSRILDVGCGMGPLLDVLSSKGFEVFGLEIGKKSWEFANRRHPNHVFQGFLCDTPFHDDFFDLITMYDVIEHMQDPIGAMHQARRLLKPGGWVYLLTPNIFSINSRLFGQHWYQYKPNEHLFYFSPTSLDLLLRRCRFDEVTIQAAGVYTDLARISHPRVASSPLLAKLLSVFRNIRVSFRVWVPSGHVCAFGRKEY